MLLAKSFKPLCPSVFKNKQGQNLDRLGYFGGITPLNASGDPPLSKLKFQELSNRVVRGPMLLAKLIELLHMFIGI